MKKQILFITLNVLLVAFSGCKKGEENIMNATEVVLYQIKADKIANYLKVSELANNFLKARQGFISRTVKQDHKDKKLFLDIVEWETLETALAASKAAEKEPSLKPFFEAFEKVISFNYFHPFN